ncbi:MAG TPA: hypothetical protein VMB85_14485 [Bryobacteraceae bacterium]|nr:hypothetical protein [Bryobacteraceae bacterium]
MAPNENLFETLRASEMNSAELGEIVQSCLPGTRTRIGQQEVIFGLESDDTSYAVKFVFGEHGIVQIMPGPSLNAEQVVAIRGKVDRELREPAPVWIGTAVLFSVCRVAGWFRHRDKLQILPVPPDSPRALGLGGEPFLVQFPLRGSSEWALNAMRREVEVQRAHLLLNALLELGISRSRGVRHHWVLLPPENTIAYCQEMYAFPPGLSAVPTSEGFSPDSFAPTDRLDPMTAIDPATYFTRRPAVNSLDRRLEIPSNLGALLDRFYSSANDDQERFLRACFWFDHARTVSHDSSSAQFTALMFAIESLMPNDGSRASCPTCKRSLGKGARRRLREFLERYAPAQPQLHKNRVELYYQLRCQLAHGGYLTLSDRGSIGFHGLLPKYPDELDVTTGAHQLVRIILINWLLARGREAA